MEDYIVQKPIGLPKSVLLLLSILGVLVISTLVVISSYFLRPSIELDLKAKLIDNFSKAGVDNSIIYVSGRDITLSGSVSSKADAKISENIAKSVWGVRQVNNSLLIEAKEIE